MFETNLSMGTQSQRQTRKISEHSLGRRKKTEPISEYWKSYYLNVQFEWPSRVIVSSRALQGADWEVGLLGRMFVRERALGINAHGKKTENPD